MKQLKYLLRTVTIAATKRIRINDVASFLMLVSNSGTSRVQVAIENDELSDFPIGYGYEERSKDGFFKFFDLYNPNAGSVTVEYIVSTGLITPSPTIQSLEDILDQLKGITTAGSFDDATVGLAAGQIVAANSSRHSLIIQAKASNAGIIYLGYANTVTSAKWFAELQAGMSWSTDDYLGPVYGIATIAAQVVGYGEH